MQTGRHLLKNYGLQLTSVVKDIYDLNLWKQLIKCNVTLLVKLV